MRGEQSSHYGVGGRRSVMMMVMRAFLVDLRTAHTLRRGGVWHESTRDQGPAPASVGPRAERQARADRVHTTELDSTERDADEGAPGSVCGLCTRFTGKCQGASRRGTRTARSRPWGRGPSHQQERRQGGCVAPRARWASGRQASGRGAHTKRKDGVRAALGGAGGTLGER